MKSRAEILFQIGLIEYTWFIDHNLDEFCQSIEQAFNSWAARVDEVDITIDNFCDYVMSKDKNFLCIPSGEVIETHTDKTLITCWRNHAKK